MSPTWHSAPAPRPSPQPPALWLTPLTSMPESVLRRIAHDIDKYSCMCNISTLVQPAGHVAVSTPLTGTRNLTRTGSPGAGAGPVLLLVPVHQ